MSLPDFADRFTQRFPHLVGRRLLVAVSGGPDSVALLHLLGEPRLKLDLAVAHVHHAVRGEEADLDADFCRRLSDDLQLPFHLLRLEPRPTTASGREAAWRLRRYQALLGLKDRIAAAAVATGHQRDDVAEGVLLQLLRGTGPRALAGISVETPEGVVRPLLDWGRADILEWLRDRRLSWREDSSNRDLGHLRNLIRHVVLPDLCAVSPRLDRHLVALAHDLALDDRFLTGELDRRASWIDPWDADGGVPVAAISELPQPLRSRWLHAQAARTGIGKVSRRQVELFEEVLRRGGRRAVTLNGRWRLRLARSRLWLEPPLPPATYAIQLTRDATVELPLPGWRVRLRAAGAPDPTVTWWRRASGEATLTVRSPAPGERIGAGSRSMRVSRLLAERLPRHLRHAWPVFCENDTISWIPGVWQAPEGGDLLLEVTAHGGSAGSVQR